MLASKLLLAIASVLPAAFAQTILTPNLDPFYTPPPGYQATAPGTILRTRKVTTSYFGAIPNPVDSYQLLYRTTAIDGSAIAGVTTVFKPTDAQKDKFVSFHTAYDGAARSGVCDPSYNYELLSPQVDLISSAEFFLLEAYVASGYIVSSPDYEGPDSAFAAGRLSGTGVLDSMRAVGNFKQTLGFSNNKPAVVGYGYSGGGIATGWAASLKEKYAPELNIKGWASGGTPANLTGTAVFIDGTAFAGFLPQAIAGLDAPSSYQAQIQPTIDRIVTPYGKAVLALAEQECGPQNLVTFGFMQVLATSFQSEGYDVLYDPIVRGVLQQQTMGQKADETPRAPVYLYHALQDEIIPYQNASTLYDEWCAYGASVNFVTYENGGHLSTEIIGFPDAYKFVQAAFAGTVPTTGCTRSTTLNNDLDPVALGAELEPELAGAANALAAEGRNDENVKNNPAAFQQKITS